MSTEFSAVSVQEINSKQSPGHLRAQLLIFIANRFVVSRISFARHPIGRNLNLDYAVLAHDFYYHNHDYHHGYILHHSRHHMGRKDDYDDLADDVHD